LREHLHLCRTYMHRVPVKDVDGETLRMLGDPDPAKLARHVQLYGREGAEHWLQVESPSALHAAIRRRAKAGTSRTSQRRSRSRMNKRDNSSTLSKESAG
jgi:hypothetical protein